MIIYLINYQRSDLDAPLRPLGRFVPLLVFLALSLFRPSAHAFQPNTIKLGMIEVHPSFQSKATYSSNIALTNEAVPDVILEQAPAIIFQWEKTDVPVKKPRFSNAHGLSIDFLLDLYLMRIAPMGDRGYMGKAEPHYASSGGKPMESALMSAQRLRRFSFFLEYEPTVVNLIDNSEFNGVDHRLLFAGDIRFPGGVYLRIDETFISASSITSYRDDVVNLTADQRSQGIGYHNNMLSLTIGYNFYSEYVFFLTYTNYLFFVRNFDASTSFQGLPLPPGLETEWVGIDSDTMGLGGHSGGAYLATNIRKKTNISFGYVFGKVKGNLDEFGLEASMLGGLLPVSLTSNSDPRNAVFQEARLGFQRALTAHDVVMGWPVAKTLLEAELAYHWREFETFTMLAESGSLTLLSYSVNQEDYRRFLVKVRLLTEPGPRTKLRISYNSFPIEAISGSGNLSFSHQVGLALSHLFPRRFSAGTIAMYRYTQTNSEGTDSTQGISFYQIEATLGYSMQAWLNAALNYQFLAQRNEIEYNNFDSHRCYVTINVHF